MIEHDIGAAHDAAKEKLISPKAVDGFKTESPIRAFTDFQVSGNVAIGKGFRPAISHLSRYLDAMETKEGWLFVQVLLPTDDAGDPTVLFHRAPKPIYIGDIGSDAIDLYAGMAQHMHGDGGERVTGKSPALAAPYGGRTTDQADPINPTYYHGTACAEIIEYMPTNVGIATKYMWRFGEKDITEIEIGKAIWYLEREIILHIQEVAPRPVFGLSMGPLIPGIPETNNVDWFRHMAKARINASTMPDWCKRVVRHLVNYTATGQRVAITDAIDALKRGDETGTGLAI